MIRLPSAMPILATLILAVPIGPGLRAAGPRQDVDLGKLGKEFERIVDKVEPSVVDIRIQEKTLEKSKQGRTAVITRKTLFRLHLRPKHTVQPQRDVRIFRRIGTGLL